MIIRAYRPEQDHADLERIWREVGWIESDDGAKALKPFLESGRTMVAESDGSAECAVSCVPGRLRHVDADLGESRDAIHNGASPERSYVPCPRNSRTRKRLAFSPRQ